MTLVGDLFKRHCFDRLVMVLCVSYKSSYRDLVEMMAERGCRARHNKA